MSLNKEKVMIIITSLVAATMAAVSCARRRAKQDNSQIEAVEETTIDAEPIGSAASESQK